LKRKWAVLTGTIVCVVLLDVITKAYVASAMVLHESIVVIDGFFNITYVRNPGAAFGFLAGAPPVFRMVFFLLVTVVVVVLILFYIGKSRDVSMRETFSLSLILSGAIGNLIDRVRFGEVIDFLDVYIGSFHWPAFNVADSAISIGAAFLLFSILRHKKEDV
jgi:signal peptidase II